MRFYAIFCAITLKNKSCLLAHFVLLKKAIFPKKWEICLFEKFLDCVFGSSDLRNFGGC